MPDYNYTEWENDWGFFRAVFKDNAIIMLFLPGISDRDFHTKLKKARIINLNMTNQPLQSFDQLKRELEDYFSGSKTLFKTPYALNGTPFQQKVWKAISKIPYGQTRTYGEIAEYLGNKGASRAVGQACGANPLPILIPCHRVVGREGKLGGFTGGLTLKKRLLALESQALSKAFHQVHQNSRWTS